MLCQNLLTLKNLVWWNTYLTPNKKKKNHLIQTKTTLLLEQKSKRIKTQIIISRKKKRKSQEKEKPDKLKKKQLSTSKTKPTKSQPRRELSSHQYFENEWSGDIFSNIKMPREKKNILQLWKHRIFKMRHLYTYLEKNMDPLQQYFFVKIDHDMDENKCLKKMGQQTK